MNEIKVKQVLEMMSDLPGHITLVAKNLLEDDLIRAPEALALIVDAAKREMGEAFSKIRRRPSGMWRCDIVMRGLIHEEEHPTEAQAVLAAYRAWKEGR